MGRWWPVPAAYAAALLLFFAAYAVYFWREIRSGAEPDEDDEQLEPLKLQPTAARPATWAVLAQTTATLVVIFFASQLFVGAS